MQRTMRQYVLILGGLFIPSLEGFAGVSWDLQKSYDRLSIDSDYLEQDLFVSAYEHVCIVFYDASFCPGSLIVLSNIEISSFKRTIYVCKALQ